ncbi:MAG: dihydroneopterin aldolase [Gammaproteobacteria bacterium]
MRLFCKIGIDPAEACAPQLLLADIEIAPVRRAENTPVVDYAAVFRRLQSFAAEKQHGLMEEFAEQAAQIILSEFAAEEVRIYCRKPRPFADLGEAGVEFTATREN